MEDRERMEPREPQPLERGRCDYCGNPAPRGRSYCCSTCRVAYNNLLGRQGKAVMQMLKLWRKHRGRRGTPGEGMIGEIANRVDALLKEDQARKRSMEKPPT